LKQIQGLKVGGQGSRTIDTLGSKGQTIVTVQCNGGGGGVLRPNFVINLFLWRRLPSQTKWVDIAIWGLSIHITVGSSAVEVKGHVNTPDK
jgi:hypothetical protein